MSSTTRGYYSIFQYCPDPSRLETVNVGVALFCPEIGFLQTRFGRRRTPVHSLFGKQDWEFVEAQQAALEARLSRGGKGEFQDMAGFEGFVAKRAGAFRMTPPRPVKVESAEVELRNLFQRLVRRQGVRNRTVEKRISTELKSCFKAAGVVDLLQANITVHPPGLPKPFKAPFAYQNGRLNLIEPVQFEGMTTEAAFKTASAHAVAGEFLEDYRDPRFGELRLVVVGKFEAVQEEAWSTAAAVFKRNAVPLHRFGNLEPLMETIRREAHE